MTRIAVIGTPRSGNTWIRHVLRDALGLSDYAVHNYRDLPSRLDDRAILQIHWPREPGLQSFLRDNGFRVVVPKRHPLDVLISVLHFVRREPLTARWLEGNAEIPVAFAGETPCSSGFERYACGWGAENLLSVSYQWSFDAQSAVTSYESLVRAPEQSFSALIETLGADPADITRALSANPFAFLKNTPNKHAWQGSPGLWRTLIPWPVARRIQFRHRQVFDRLDYDVPVYVLSARRAEATWKRLAI
jgi:hypothetical protein